MGVLRGCKWTDKKPLPEIAYFGNNFQKFAIFIYYILVPTV